MRGVVLVIAAVVLASTASAFVSVEHWSVHDDAPFYEFVENNVDLDVLGMKADEIKVVFAIPELAVRESKGPYAWTQRNERISRSIILPDDAEPGEYVIRMTITDSKGNKRIRHRIIEIE
ncbi:MAG: hypothetical protein QXT19_05165 [Candidatus Woesearchaeota archaeon]